MEQFCSTFDQACTRTLKPEFFIRQFIRGNIAKKVLRINLIILICSNKGILELKISNIYIFNSFFFVKIILKNPTRIPNNIYLSIRTQIVVINFYKNKKKMLRRLRVVWKTTDNAYFSTFTAISFLPSKHPLLSMDLSQSPQTRWWKNSIIYFFYLYTGKFHLTSISTSHTLSRYKEDLKTCRTARRCQVRIYSRRPWRQWRQ